MVISFPLPTSLLLPSFSSFGNRFDSALHNVPKPHISTDPKSMLQTGAWCARKGSAREVTRLANVATVTLTSRRLALAMHGRYLHATGLRGSARPPGPAPSSPPSSSSPLPDVVSPNPAAAPSSSVKWASTAEAAAAERRDRENEAVVATQVGALANIGLAGCKVRPSPPPPHRCRCPAS